MLPQSPSILLICEHAREDSRIYALLRAATAGSARIELCPSVEAARTAQASEPCDLVLLDEALLQTDTATWQTAFAAERPVVLLIAAERADVADALERAGADDYVALDTVDAALLKRVIGYCRKLHQLRQRSRLQPAQPQPEQPDAARLDASDQKLRGVLENSRDVIYQLDLRTGAYEYVTPSVVDVLGYSVEEFMATGAEEASAKTFPDDRDRVAAHIAQLLRADAPAGAPEIEYRIQTGHRGWRWVVNSRRVLRDAAGTPVALVGSLRDITESKQHLQTIRESEQRFRRIVETTQEGVFVLELPATITYVNERMVEMLGYTTAEVLGRSLLELVTPADAAALTRQMRRRQAGQRSQYETQMVHKDGSIRWCRVSAAPMVDDSGTITGSFGMVQDITERKLAEAARDRLAAVVDAMPDCVATISAGFALLSINPAGRTLLGLDADADVSQINVEALLPEQLRQRLATEVVPAALRDGYWSGESTLRRLDGREFPVSQVLIAHKDSTGAVEYFSAISSDISARAMAEDALIASEARKAAIIEAALDAFITIDSAGRILEFNSAAERIFHYARADVLGKDMASLLVPAAWRSSHRRGLRHYARTGEGAILGQRLELTARRADGAEFPIELTIVSVLIAGQTVFTSFIRDITDRKRNEAALRDSQQRLQVALQAANVGLWDSDLERNTTSYSPEWTRQLGYEPDELSDSPREWDSRVHPDDYPAAIVEVRRCLSGEIPTYRHEFRLRHKDGSYRWIMSQATVLRRADGSAYRMLGAHLDITDRKRALEDVRASEERLALAQEIAQLGSWERDLRTGAVTWSDEMFRIFGLERATTDLATMDLRQFVHPDEQALYDDFATAIASHRGRTADHRVIRRDGSMRFVRHRVEIVRDADGHPVRVAGTMLDITERKAVEDELLYQANLLQNVSDAIIATDINFRVTSWNHAAEQMYGWSAAEVIGLSVGALLATEYAGVEQQQVLQDFKAQGAWSGEVIQHHRDGTPINVLSSTTLIRDAAGTATGAIAVNRDITEFKRADAAARSSRERLDIALRSAKVGLWEWEAATNHTFLSDQWKRQLGYAPDELSDASEPWLTRLHPDDEPLVRQRVVEQMGGAGADYTNSYRLQHKDGSYRWMLVQGTIARDAAGVPESMIGTQIDISELKYAEEALLRAADKLQRAHDQLERRVQERTVELVLAKEEAERANAAKSEFLSRMSHELRTPMNSILGFAQIMEMDDLSAKQAERVGYIIKAGQHLLHLINEVLDLARVEAGRLQVESEAVCVQHTVQLTTELIQPLIAKRAQRLIFDWDASALLYVAADSQRLSQVLLNLLSNATKYNRIGGEIRVQAVAQPEHRVRISVIDTGPGIDPADRTKLFQPFERLEATNTTEGTGLGLALSKRLVELMGGQMDVVSTPGMGSHFWLDLPAADIPLRTVVVAPAPLPALPANAHTILYIEDNLANLEVIQHALAGQPRIELLSAHDGTSGLALAQNRQPALILLDLHLPDIQGEDVLQQLRSSDSTSGIQIVVISADATPHRIRRLMALGAADYLTKPLDVRLLVDVVNSILKKAETPYAS